MRAVNLIKTLAKSQLRAKINVRKTIISAHDRQEKYPSWGGKLNHVVFNFGVIAAFKYDSNIITTDKWRGIEILKNAEVPTPGWVAEFAWLYISRTHNKANIYDTRYDMSYLFHRLHDIIGKYYNYLMDSDVEKPYIEVINKANQNRLLVYHEMNDELFKQALGKLVSRQYDLMNNPHIHGIDIYDPAGEIHHIDITFADANCTPRKANKWLKPKA